MRDLSVIYRDYYPRIVGYLKRLLGDLEAEDIAQETFMKVGRSLESFRGDSSLSTWIYRIATNTAMDHLRRPSSRNARQEDALEPSTAEETGPADTAPLLDELIIRKDMRDCIRGIVDGLPDTYRMALLLSEFEGLSNSEIADVLAVSIDATKIRLHRARARLRKALEDNCTFYRDERNELSCDRKPASLIFLKK